ncbi:hypothetical protein BG261_08055 [Floricoccus tropicus]|uniref:Uncharacterized protein n=1 Tax=Floricoccus tropicus TaxID=1859473 RepID=A0A1E8GJ72_9LACT|nr:hypothetical protein [Floricoccus tropicus]OFI48227.1 hypothetical protein BG261_08055 [Floricoccus tropicus]
MGKTRLVEFHDSKKNHYYSLGYILEENDKFIIFESVDLSGRLESILIARKNKKQRFIKKSKYIDLYKKIISYNKKNNLYNPYKLTIQNKLLQTNTEQDLTNILNNLIKEKIFVTIEAKNNDKDFNDDNTRSGWIEKITKKNNINFLALYDNLDKLSKLKIKQKKIAKIELVSVRGKVIDKVRK